MKNTFSIKRIISIILFIFFIAALILTVWYLLRMTQEKSMQLSQKPITIKDINNINQQSTPKQQEDNSLTNQENKQCQGFYANYPYQAKSILRKISFDVNNIKNDSYKFFEDDNISFYYPVSWQLKLEEKIISSDNIDYIFRLLFDHKNRFLTFLITKRNIHDFIEEYNECLTRCFSDATPNSFSLNSLSCSEDFSQKDLEKFLLGSYIYQIKTGSLPPNGSGSLIFYKVLNNNDLLNITFTNEYFLYLPIYDQLNKGRDWSEFTLEEKEQIQKEIDQIIESFFVISESFK